MWQAVKKGKLLVSLPKARQLAAESSDQALQALMDRVPSDLWAAKLALPVSCSILLPDSMPRIRAQAIKFR